MDRNSAMLLRFLLLHDTVTCESLDVSHQVQSAMDLRTMESRYVCDRSVASFTGICSDRMHKGPEPHGPEELAIAADLLEDHGFARLASILRQACAAE